MEVLVAEDDVFMSLEEALAFIDGCEVQDQSPTETLVENGPRHSLSEVVTPAELLRVSSKPTTRRRPKPQRKTSESSSSSDDKPTKKRRTRSANSSSTRLQQRKRAEIRALREQAQELETQVELLKKNRFLPADVALEVTAELEEEGTDALVASQKTPSNWHEMAVRQYRERLVSEKTNRRLKSILENQEKVNGALNRLLQKRSILTGMEFVLSAQPGMEPSLVAAESSTESAGNDGNKKVLAELETLVQGLYKEWKAKFHSPTQSPAISCDMRTKEDPQRGKMIEFITTTPMSCPVKKAGEILWKELTTYREYPDKVYKYMKCTKPNSHEKNFDMNVRTPSGMLELNGLQYMQKYDEEDRTVFVVAERMTVPSKNIEFRDECWMTVTPSSTDAKTSVVEIFLQLYMGREEESQVSPEDISYAQNTVMASLGNAYRKFFQAEQNTLMDKAWRIVLPCPSKLGVIV
ncbi:hypothetical protein PR001_g22967 [Phytophthora rubi]|uniref:Uncharacterized protein n=1 Tax=Phytophthora rubi TaxID=129364 RepID=A0A6A3IQG3_9STRA|nr:hypothetical protein PR002_g23357 [Phytophthora rubi]KAE8985179.1 hypothetical protein PR001_g22967 [Phytophthora rubi]